MWYVHINRNIIDSNRKHGRSEPPIAVKQGKGGKASYGHRVIMHGPCELVYGAGDPLLPCGARVILKSLVEPEIAE